MVETAIPAVMTRAEAAEFLRMKPAHLANLATKRRGPRFSKLAAGAKGAVRYLRTDLIAWVTKPAEHEIEVWGDPRKKPNIRRQKAGRA